MISEESALFEARLQQFQSLEQLHAQLLVQRQEDLEYLLHVVFFSEILEIFDRTVALTPEALDSKAQRRG